ncbi:MAG: NAD(P)/FAD-dependent oxidoreductase [Bacteroidales bacterium]|jgi:all-trans-retinol 13,14-reductase|nr:NAD(P)/FAD-dependent oxidoreductase [Bacteroidales bacterium]
MEKYDVIIIGSGLSGLECAYILSRKGYHVCVLEQNAHIGGCLQTFRRGKTTFDTGFHYVGGLEEGQSLHALFRYFDLLDLPWQKMDEDGFSEVIIQGKSYMFPSGHERFADKMAEYFPHQRQQIVNYTSFLKKVGENIMNSFQTGVKNDFTASTLLERSAYDFLQNSFDDPLLINVLSGASFTMELCAEKLPLYVFAQINNSFIQSAWRLKGGGSLIAEKLADNIRRMGGEVHTNAKVTRFNEHGGLMKSVCVNNGEEIAGKHFISSMHPALTLSLIPETSNIRNIYRKRINNMENTHGIFTAHLQLKPDTVPYLNRNINIFNGTSPWNDAGVRSSGTTAALVSFQMPKSGGAYTSNIDILTPMLWQEVAQWANGRGAAYSAFKAQKAEECVHLVSKRLPHLKDSIERIYTSTPLTYRDYTGTYEGSAYGIRKDYSHLVYTLLSPQTQIPNLLLTGQNLNLHGVLGVSMTSFFTCAKWVGMESLIKELENGGPVYPR